MKIATAAVLRAAFIFGLISLGSVAQAGAFSDPPTEQEIFRAHLFEEPLVPIGGHASADENRALADALTTYAERTSNDDVTAVTGFLQAHPQSPWRVSLLTDLGIVYYRTAHFSKCVATWQAAWDAGKGENDPQARLLVDRAVGELAKMEGRLGQIETIAALLQDVATRNVRGPGETLLTHARQELALMQQKPEVAFRCGPLAVDRIRAFKNPKVQTAPQILASASTINGTSLAYVASLAHGVGLDYQMAKRENDSEPPTPCVVHWKVGHTTLPCLRSPTGAIMHRIPRSEMKSGLALKPLPRNRTAIS